VEEDPQETFRRVRLQGEFERMLWAVVQTALLSGAVRLVAAVAAAFGAPFSLGGALAATGAALGFAAIVFLSGFIAVAVAGAPVARYLDREDILAQWPFYALGAASAAAATTLLGAFPTFERPERLFYIAPGLIAAHLYARSRIARRRRAEAARTLH